MVEEDEIPSYTTKELGALRFRPANGIPRSGGEGIPTAKTQSLVLVDVPAIAFRGFPSGIYVDPSTVSHEAKKS